MPMMWTIGITAEGSMSLVRRWSKTWITSMVNPMVKSLLESMAKGFAALAIAMRLLY